MASAQADISIGSGSTGNTGSTYPCPLQDYYEGSRAQYLFRASELNAAGMSAGFISALKFNVTSLNGFSGSIEQLSVKIGTTSTNSLSTSSTVWENIGTTYFGPVDFTPAAGVNVLTFTSPFLWDGTSNIVIEICNGLPVFQQTGSSYTSNVSVPWTTGLPFNASHTSRGDGLGNLCGATSGNISGLATTRPNTSFTWTAATACSGPPATASAVTTTPGVCPGQLFTVTLNGLPSETGLTYQWQTSTDNITFTNIPGETNKHLSTLQATAAYYRALITCANGGSSQPSSSVFLSISTIMSGNYTINSGQSTGGTNFQTFADAAARLSCAGISGPVVLTVAPGSGPYLETVTIPQIPGASAVNTITFKGNLATLRYTSNDANKRSGIILNGADHVTIDSLIVDVSAGTYGYGIGLTGQADSNRITNCKIVGNTSSSNTDHSGIMISAFTGTNPYANNSIGNLIANNTITGGYYGICLFGGTSQFNKRNILRDNLIQDFYVYGIYAHSNDSVLISGNNISRPSRSNVTTGYGVYCNSLTNAVIEKNRVHNMFGATSNELPCYSFYINGDGISEAQPNVLMNNLVYNINSASGDIYGIYGYSHDYWNYYHNTIVLDHAAATSGNTYGMYLLYGTGVNVKNNVVYIARGGNGAKFNIFYPSSVTSSNNNVLVMKSTGGTSNNIGNFYDNYYPTLEAWQAASRLDLQSVSIEPIFMNPATGDYTATNPFVINGVGTGLGVATDMLGRMRNTPPDPGAFEFPAAGQDGALTWVSPVQPMSAGAKDIIVKLSNTRSTSITSVQLSYTDGASVVTQDFTGLNLSQGNSIDLTFTTPYNLSQSATLRAYINVVNGIADTVRINDTTARQILCSSLSGTYTINNAQPTGGTNFQSFNDAVNRLNCGVSGPVVFNVIPGVDPYYERIVIPQVPGASAINNIVFKGNLATVSYFAVTSEKRAAFSLLGADHITIDSLIINVSLGSYGWGVLLTGQADSNRITNCQIITDRLSSSKNYLGIAINGSTVALESGGRNGVGNLIYNNKISGGFYGIYLYGENLNYFHNRKNEIRNNTVQDFYAYGIYTMYNDSILISKNDISRPTRTDTYSSAYGAYLGHLRNAVIEKNRVHNLFEAMPGVNSSCYAFYIDGRGISEAQPNVFINNLVYNINLASGYIAGVYAFPGYFWNFYHNTIVLDAAGAGGTTYGIRVEGLGVNVRNNIIYIAREGNGEKINLYYIYAVASSNNNVLTMKSTSGTWNYIGYTGGLRSQTLSNWQTLTNYDLQSVSSDPLFANPVAGDFTPTEPTVINGVGVGIGIATDILDRMRNTPPDPGAFEYGVTAGLDGALTWISPAAGASAAGSKTIVARLSNTQAIPITSARVSYSDGNSVVTQDFSGFNLAHGDFTTLTFSTPYNLTQNTKLFAYASLVNNVADTVKANDTTARQSLCVIMSGTYTINKNVPASATNFQSFNAAAGQLICAGVSGPVVLNVVPGSGPYSERFIIDSIPGASAINTITVKGGGNALVYSSNSSTDPVAAIVLNRTDHLTIDSLVVDVTEPMSGWGILLTNKADSNRIINCRVMASQNYGYGKNMGILLGNPIYGAGGILDDQVSGNLIANNTITGGHYGIHAYGSSLAFNKRNIIKGNTVQDFYSSGIYAYRNDSIIISGNDISRPARSSVGDGAGILVTGSYRVLIEKNRIHDLFGASPNTNSSCTGISVSGSYSATGLNNVVNNLIYNLKSAGSIFGISGSYGYWNFYHNTIVLDDTAGASMPTHVTYGMDIGGAPADVKNNIIYINRGGIGTKINLYYSSPVASSNNNVLVMKSTSGNNFIVRDGSASYTTLGAWQSATNYDLQSITHDPQFRNPAAGNYSPTADSVDNKGINVGVADDIAGKPRSIPPDPGAYEFSTTGPDAAISWVSPLSGPATAGMKTITVNITNTRAVAITSARLSYTDGITTETEEFTGLNILTGGSQQLSFSTPYNFTQTDTLYAYIGLINGVVDDRQLNDTTAIQPFDITARVFAASREFTDVSEWTHYYHDNNTASDLSDDVLLLSIKKNGNNIGAVGDGTFELKVGATAGAGSGNAVEVNNTLIPGGAKFYSMNRYWNVIPTQQPSSPVHVRFYYNTQDLTDVKGSHPSAGQLTHTQLSMYKLTGGNPDPTSNWTGATQVDFYQHSSTPSLASWVYSALNSNRHQAEFVVNNFSGGGAGAKANVVLPVTYLNFDLVQERDRVRVLWSTASETGSKHFLVQRSLDGNNFETIGTVAAAGSSSVVKNYGYDDYAAVQYKGRMVFYRLYQVDLNSQGKYTEVKNVKIPNTLNKFTLLYNPVRHEAVLKYDCAEKNEVTIRVIDQSGRVVMERSVSVIAGINQISLNTGSLASGIYEVELSSAKDYQKVRMMKE